MYVFRNKGVIDPRSITTFGVSSKETKSPIGFFGTGLKYAIAVILRTGGSITIHSGSDTYTFGIQNTKIRVNEFDIVTMNGEPLGFTTELGKTWEVWQVFRELACNTIDEGGEYCAVDSYSRTQSDTTEIIVSGQVFASAWAERKQIILESTPLWASEDVECHKGESYYYFYKGVRCARLERPSMYTWNIKRPMELTEDRTFRWSYMADDTVYSAILKHAPEDVVEDCVTADRNLYKEGHAYFAGAPSDVFVRVVTDLVRMFVPRINQSAVNIVKTGNLDTFVKDETKDLSTIDKKRLTTALKFCKRLGYSINEYPIVISSHLGDGVLGRADGGKIYISTRAFTMGTKQLAGTLFEEYVHLKYKLVDCDRSMQNFLIDTICSLGERITGVPL